MNYNNSLQNQRAARFIEIACGSLFCLFTFLYLWRIQGGVLGMAQHVLSHGLTVYSPLIGAFIITLLLWGLQVLLNRLSQLKGAWHCVSYFPSFLTLALLTSVDATVYQHISLGFWSWLYPLGLIGYVLAVVFLFKRSTLLYDARSGNVTARMLIPNMITFLLLSVGCLWLGNTKEVIHNQVSIEYNLSEGNIDKALEIGQYSKAVCPEITALRAYALYEKNELGERLFDYPQNYGADGLLLNLADTVRMIFSPLDFYRQLGAYPRYHKEPAIEYLELLNQSKQAKQPMAEQYLLCAYLLNRDIDKFADKLSQVYSLKDSLVALPRSYQEALVLYLRKNPGRFPYRNEIQEANYEDYLQMVQSIGNSVMARNKTQRDFGTTYWWYYDALSRKE